MEGKRDAIRRRLQGTLGLARELVHADCEPLELFSISPPVGRIPYEQAMKLEYRPATLGDRLGPLWATYWLRVGGTVPSAWAGSRVDLIWATGTESTLWRDGRPAQGLVSGEYDRQVAPLLARAGGGERLEAAVELACNAYFGFWGEVHDKDRPAALERAELASFDAEAWDLYHDLRVLVELEADRGAGLDPAWAGQLLAGLDSFCDVWAPEDRGSWPGARETLADLLEAKNGSRVYHLGALGHGHLDTAWLWPLAETWRKCQRTFSAQLALMREYPEHRFACAGAVHYDWVKQRDPEMYAEIQERIERGQWVPVGGTWVEPDCNLPAGESLVRHFLYGQRFFERELGARATEFWNPDVFGYASQLPQIMRGAGISRFLTQKLSWNQFTSPLHHTFTWEGLDGSRVLTHFPPADSYDSGATVAELRMAAANYKDHDFSRHGLFVFGHGDGGGGPTAEMLETLRRCGDLQGVPRTRILGSEEFFDELEADADGLPVVVGELYLETHRGTYTTQGAIKRGNRRAEVALHDAELLAAVATRLGGREYPRARLAELWQTLLLNQFHDILPGSSIAEVNAEARDQLEAVEHGARSLCEEAAAALMLGQNEEAPVNTIGSARAEVAEAPDGELAFVEAPAYGLGRRAAARDAVTVEETDRGWRLRNRLLTAEVARDGTLSSLALTDEDREALAGPANMLEVYEDRSFEYNAWDIESFHLRTGRPVGGAGSAAVARMDSLRVELEFEYEIGAASRMVQIVSLDAFSRRVEFHCDVEWRERHRLLKVAFPLAVHAHQAAYEMPFGHTERPTHFSTAADLARFEVPGHRWADLSEPGFGVALLNDCKYGHSAFGNVLRLTLLRSPTDPDPEADQGRHRFAYALMPHRGDWREAGVVAEARRFNQPLLWFGDGPQAAAPPLSWAAVDNPNLVLDTVKCAEDGDALVLRLYEAHGTRGTAGLRLGIPFSSARFSNLLEDPGAAAEVSDDRIAIPFRPHEVVTLVVD